MSSNQRYGRRAIDDAIDRAIGDMMELDPRPGLRRRVLSRIERPANRWALWSAGRSGLWRRGSWELVAAAAVLMIIVAVIAPRWRASSVELALGPSAPVAPSARLAPSALPAPGAPSAPGARSAPGAPSASGALPAPAAPSAPVAPAPRSVFGPRTDRVSAASIEDATAHPEPVDSPPAAFEAGALALAPIVVSPLAQMQELRIAPIEIQRITVLALSPAR